MLSSKYTPSTQKALFNKDIVTQAKRWINALHELSDNSDSVKRILFFAGPTGCGKTTTLNLLFKGFNINDIDATEIRSSERIIELTSTIPGFSDLTLSNIEKWNHKSKKDFQNIIVVDNIELCEKNILTFVDVILHKKNINVPVILIGNNVKYKEMFEKFHCTTIEFKKPSLLELTKLINEINQKEQLNLTKNNTKSVVEKSEYDVRQLFHILEQWKATQTDFDTFIDTIQRKQIDIDLLTKMRRVTDNTPFETNDMFNLCASEPLGISNGIFQNYPSALSKNENILDAAVNITGNLSIANLFHNHIFEDQCWELYDSFTMSSCVLPSYTIKSNNLYVPKVDHTIVPYKDVSYNYINSFEEVKDNCKQLAVPSDTFTSNGIFNAKPYFCYSLAKMIIIQLETLNKYFEQTKKGKNTSKQEKIDICKGIQNGSTLTALEGVVDKIYSYKLFEVDKLNQNAYQTDEEQQKHLSKIDIRMLKRFVNIFTFHDTTKLIKPHVEVALKYKLLQKLISETKIYESQIGQVAARDVADLTEDLGNIWKLT
jgi:DNA polymerase III delta prime subunit